MCNNYRAFAYLISTGEGGVACIMEITKSIVMGDNINVAPDCVLRAIETIERGEAKAAVFVVTSGDQVHRYLKVGVAWVGENETWRQTLNPHGELDADDAYPICAAWEERQDASIAAARTAYRLTMLAAATKGQIALQRYVYS